MTGRYKVYAETKNSNTEWLGEVPTHWVVSKFAYVKTVLTDYTANGSFADLKKNVTYKDEPSFARLVRLTDLRRDLDNDGVWIDEGAYNYLKKSALFGGEFLLANVGAYAGLFYQMPYNKGAASLAPNMFMAKFSETKILPLFMAYVGQCDPINKQLTLNATASSAQPKLNKDDFKSIKFCYPPLIEQQKIANFLDHETAKIDTLITKQEKLIELLKEKRQAVISHAVTKGISYKGQPNAPMKDSGVEWLGEVPEHWVKIAFKKVIKTRKGVAFSTSDFCDNGVRVVKASDIKLLSLRQSDVFLPINFIKKYPKAYLTQGNIILSTVGSSPDVKNSAVGQIAMVPKELDNTLLNQNTVVFEPIDKKIDRDYLFFLLQTTAYRDHLDLHAHGTANQASLNVADMLNFKCFTPPLNEQKHIAVHLYKFLEIVSTLETRVINAIQLMQERKTALISAAVTGNIDVRDWTASGEV